MDYLISARPTAVNIADAGQKLKVFCADLKSKVIDVMEYKKT